MNKYDRHEIAIQEIYNKMKNVHEEIIQKFMHKKGR